MGDLVMYTIANDRRGQAKPEGRMPTESIWLVAVLVTLFLMSIAVNAITFFADSNSQPRPSTAQDCSLAIGSGIQ